MTNAAQIDNQPPDTPADSPLLTITPAAAEKVRALLEERELSGYALRVFAQEGGCSGLSYGLGFEDHLYPQDHEVECEGIRLVIDSTSLMVMAGSEIDYVESLAGFVVHNPNVLSCSSCSSSHSGGGCSGCR